MKEPYSMGIREMDCAKCSKKFIVAPAHIYKKGSKYYCSWSCYNHRKEEMCIVCGATIPEGLQVCPNCEHEVKTKRNKKEKNNEQH